MLSVLAAFTHILFLKYEDNPVYHVFFGTIPLQCFDETPHYSVLKEMITQVSCKCIIWYQEVMNVTGNLPFVNKHLTVVPGD